MRGTIEHVTERMSPEDRDRAFWETMLDAKSSGAKLSISEIAAAAGVGKAAVTLRLGQMAAVGYVQMARAPRGDRLPPVNVWWLTPAGRRHAEAVLQQA